MKLEKRTHLKNWLFVFAVSMTILVACVIQIRHLFH